MSARVLALALTLAAGPAASQSVWSRARLRGADAARRHRDAAGVHALFAELGGRLQRSFLLDSAEAAALLPARQRESARACVDAALGLDPDDPQALALAASLRAHRGDDPTVALRLADRALAAAPAGPDRADLLFTRALATLHLGRYEEARDAWQRSLAEPLSARSRAITLGNLADTLLVLRDPRGAVDAYRGAVEADPENELAWLGLGVALDRAGIDPHDALAHGVAVAAELLAGRARGAPFDSAALAAALARPEVFFEPPFERHYHTALAWEAGARAHEPGGRAAPDADRAQALRRAAREAWAAYLREAPADDPWRLRAALHLRQLDEAAP